MLRSSFLSSTRPVYAAQDNAAPAETTPKANRARQTADKDKETDDGSPRAVYLSPQKTAADIVVRLESMAEASLRFLSSIVVHMAVRTYSLVDGDRVASPKLLMDEIETIIQTYAKGKRGGKEFEHAWTSRIMQASRAMAGKLISDGGKGVAKGPIGAILRCKTVDKANDIVFDHCMTLTKGSNSFTALSKVLAPAKKPTSGNKTGSNAVKPVAGTNASVAKRVLSDKGYEVLNAIPGKAVAKATKLADTIAKSNVDHRTFVLRALQMIDSAEVLLEIAEECKKLARAMSKAKNNDTEAKPKESEAAA